MASVRNALTHLTRLWRWFVDDEPRRSGIVLVPSGGFCAALVIPVEHMPRLQRRRPRIGSSC